MKKSALLIFSLVLMQLTTCSLSNTATLNTATPPAKASPTADFTATPTTIMPTATLTAIPSPTPDSDACWSRLPAVPDEVTLPGKLVFKSNGLSIIDFKQHNTRRATDKVVTNVAISPNGEWLSYFSDGRTELTIESADGQVKRQVPAPAGVGWLSLFDGLPWLDNERLWISEWPDIGESPPVDIINPFTGEQQKILSNYPGLELYPKTPGLHFEYSSVVYNPSLQLVAYPEVTKDGYAYITLWDRQAKKALARVPDGGAYGHPPIWLPDGNRFVVVAATDWDSPREWQMLSRDGTVHQLTHFQDIYGKDFEISPYASISPDGKYLAFGLSLNKDSRSTASPKKLFILNLTTLELINTCVWFRDYPAPIWSPDSQYVSVLNVNWDLHEGKPASFVVLNMEDQWVANVPGDLKSELVGWLK